MSPRKLYAGLLSLCLILVCAWLEPARGAYVPGMGSPTAAGQLAQSMDGANWSALNAGSEDYVLGIASGMPTWLSPTQARTATGSQALVTTTLTMGITAPSSGTTVTATGDIGCDVGVVVSVIATIGNAASWSAQVETAASSGSYTEVDKVQANIGLTTGGTHTLGFFCPTGRRWKIVKGGLAGVTETASTYWTKCQ